MEYIKTSTLEKTGSGVMKPVFTSIKLASLTEAEKKQLLSQYVGKNEKPLSEQEQTERLKAALSNYRTKKDFEKIKEVVFLEDKLEEKCFEFTTVEKKSTSKNNNLLAQTENDELKFHTSLWTKVPVTRLIDEKKCFDKVAKTIEFEAEHFEIFRIKDHIQNCLQALNFEDNDLNNQNIFSQLIARIQEQKYLDKTDPKKIQTLSGLRIEGALNQLESPLKKLLLPVKTEDRSEKSNIKSVQERSSENTANTTITSTFESSRSSTNENLQESEKLPIGTSSEEDWDKELGVNSTESDKTSTPFLRAFLPSKDIDLNKEEYWSEKPEITDQENNENIDTENSQLRKKPKLRQKKSLLLRVNRPHVSRFVVK